MKFAPIRAIKYGFQVWESPILEGIRRDECLCLNCVGMKPGQSDHCEVAQSLYEICKATGVAMAVSRCPRWLPLPGARL